MNSSPSPSLWFPPSRWAASTSTLADRLSFSSTSTLADRLSFLSTVVFIAPLTTPRSFTFPRISVSSPILRTTPTAPRGIVFHDSTSHTAPTRVFVPASIHAPKVLALFNDDIKYHVNPTGKFVIGGPHGDTGLTGRKIIVDTYGGKGAHGGGAFSGKDPSKVDRSAAYAARHIAKNMVAAGVADEMLVQISYAIGVAKPVNIYVDTYGRSHVQMSDGEIAKKIEELFDLRPKAIEDRLKLRKPIYEETAAYGHMGRQPQTVTKTFHSRYMPAKTMEVELFTWEKLDYVETIQKAFGL